MKSATIKNYLALTVTLIIYERNNYLNDLIKTFQYFEIKNKIHYLIFQ